MFLWVLISIVIFCAVILVATFVLPSVYLKFKCKIKRSNDRCIKRVYERNGQSLVFEPEEKWRSYVNQYVLNERKGRKVAVLKVDKNLNYIEYDLVVFNLYNKVVKVVSVKDFVNGLGITKEVELPEETSYLSLRVVRVENTTFDSNIIGKLKKGNLIKFILINLFVVLVEVLLLKICVANLLGGVFRESFLFDIRNLIISGILAGALILINSFTTLITVKAIERKNTVKDKKDA